MYKLFILLNFVLVSFCAKACPSCNIHNYLYSSVSNAEYFFKAKILKAVGEDKAKVEIIDIIKNDENDLFKIGEIREEEVYLVKEKVGQEFLFSLSYSHGPRYPVLEHVYEWEVRYLLDTTRKVTSISEAIRLLECVSRKSNGDGSTYIKENFDESFESLIQRMHEIRSQCQKYDDGFFEEHRLANLMRAIMLGGKNTRTIDFLYREIESIAALDFGDIPVDSLNYCGGTPIGKYLSTMLYAVHDDSKLLIDITARFIEVIEKNETSSVMYFSSAIAQVNPSALHELNITGDKRKSIALGILSAASTHKCYWQKDKIQPLIDAAQKICADREIDTYIEEKFD